MLLKIRGISRSECYANGLAVQVEMREWKWSEIRIVLPRRQPGLWRCGAMMLAFFEAHRQCVSSGWREIDLSGPAIGPERERDEFVLSIFA